MELVKPKDILKSAPVLDFIGGEYFARFLMHVLRFNRINKLYSRIGNKQGLEFIKAVTDILHLKVEIDPDDIKKIPTRGAAIVVANHPLGGLDGLLLIQLVSEVRGDVKILASHLLKKIEQLTEFFVDTNLYRMPTMNNDFDISGFQESVAHLQKGGLLCIFPAGESNSYDASNLVTDKVWRFPLIRFIREMEVPVIPVHFQSSNSWLFSVMGRIHPSLKNARFPSEMFHKSRRSIKIRVGNPVKKSEQARFNDLYQFGRYLRAKTYGMASDIEVRRFFNYSLKRAKQSGTIIDAVSKELILKEIEALGNDYLLFRLKEYCIYAVPAREIPQILTEIGRLREITFREVGEGTNHSIDIDEFDLYYHQLFIWDEKEQKIVGAYRIGLGREIMEQYGKRGFYLHTLFRIDDTLAPVLNQTVELGRSFVIREYQKKPLPLFLLWKGIFYFMLKNQEYRYLMGPASISNNYSRISKDLIIRFLMANHYDWQIARKVQPRNSYKFRSIDPNINVLMESTERDINKLDKTIGDMDALNSGLPVLLKKYIRINAKIAGFNVDPKFNNCLDGLIFLDLFDIPKATIESLHKEVNDGSILERFYSNRE